MEIKANELRIENYFIDQFGEIKKVESIDDFGWFLSRKDNENEIPLSELESVLKGESESKDLFKKPFRRGKKINDTILDADGRIVFKLNKGQYGHELINKIVESINND